MRKYIFLLAIAMLFTLSVSAQHQVFSQFTATPLIVNLGYTGDIEGKFRVNTNSQSEKFSKYSGHIYRFNLSADAKFALGENTELGVGINGWLKQYSYFAETIESFTIAAAIHHYFGDKTKAHHKISLGLGARQAFLSEHWSSGKYNYPLFASSLLWRYQSTSRFSVEAGLSAYGWNTPTLPFRNTGFPLIGLNVAPQATLLTWITLVELPVGSHLSLLPTVYYLSRSISFNKLSYGGLCRYYLDEGLSRRYLQFGFLGKRNVYQRRSDQPVHYLSSLMNAQFNRINIGLSYDVLASKVEEFTSDNLFELSLGLRI